MKLIARFAAALVFASPLAFAQEAPAEKPFPEPYASSLPPLVRSVAAGAEKACSPIYLTVSGPEKSGSRFYAAAPVEKFASVVRESARKNGKISREQARAIDHLLKLAAASRQTGSGFGPETIRSALAGTGLDGEAQMLCVATERASSR